jgi:HrpA-like RNA helicase
MVPAAEQRRVFVHPPVGMRKIVLATNIGRLACSHGSCMLL